MLHICKNCFNSYSGKPDVCPHCGQPIKGKKHTEQPQVEDNSANINASDKPTKKVKNHKRRHRLSSAEIMESINFEDLLSKTTDNDVKSWRERKKKDRKPDATVVNGELDINTSDVTYLPQTYTYSAKKARGEYSRPKLKWWEIYKWADLMLARRKIKKQVKKASYYKPKQISGATMITLCILFGWFGLHNFYARNYRKGWFTLISCILGLVIIFNENVFFNAIRVSIGGGLMFIVVFMWLADLMDLIFAKYKYRLSKYKFIDSLNIDTRAKLGDKYIDKDEYKKLWIVRMFNKIKRAIQNKKQNKAKKQTASDDEKSEATISQSIDQLTSTPDQQPTNTDLQPAEQNNLDNKTNNTKVTKINDAKSNKNKKPKVIKINSKNEK